MDKKERKQMDLQQHLTEYLTQAFNVSKETAWGHAGQIILEVGFREQVGERHDPKLPWDHPGFPEHRYATDWQPLQG